MKRCTLILLSHTNKLSLTHTISPTTFYFPIHYPPQSITISLTPEHTLRISHPLSFTFPFIINPNQSLTLSHPNTPCLTYTLSLSQTQTHFFCHTPLYTLYYTPTPTPTLSLALADNLSYTDTFTLTNCLSHPFSNSNPRLSLSQIVFNAQSLTHYPTITHILKHTNSY